LPSAISRLWPVSGRKVRRCALLLLVFLGITALAMAQASRRLILADGSWQEIVEYRVVDDRVQYLSTQRKAWEELPAALIDWKATNEWNARLVQAPPQPEKGAVESAGAGESLSVAAGLDLPAAGGVFLLDTFDDQPSLVEMIQVRAVLKNSTSGWFRFPLSPGGSSKERLLLKGAHSRIQAHVAASPIFVKVTGSGDEKPLPAADRFRIVRLEAGDETRVFGGRNTAEGEEPRTGQPFVSAHVASFSQGWLKLTPAEELAPGEYAMVEILPGNRINSYVWDFGVDPKAPDNANSRKPYSVVGAGASQSGQSPPKLESR